MKTLILCFILLLSIISNSQTPGLTITVIMDSVKSIDGRYKIEMKICKPKKMTERGDWFSHDSSTIDFKSLTPGDIDCGEYFDKGTSTLISGKEEELPFNQFKFSNHKFAFEEIYLFRISDRGSRGWNPEMYVMMPVKYKSFVTWIKLTNLEYQSDKVIFLDDYRASRDGMFLAIEQSLESYKTIDVKDFQLKSILEKN